MAHEDQVFSLELPDDERPGFSSDGDEKALSPRPTRSPIDSPDTLEPAFDEFIEDRTVVADFLKSFKCRSIMPQSSKVVVLDTGISVLSALQALEENDLDAAPLWDSQIHDFVGIVTVTDLIGALLSFKAELQPGARLLDVLRKTTIRQCQNTWKKQAVPFLFLEPDDNLYEAIYTLSKYKVHRIPVIERVDQNLILFVLHPTRIILFLMKVMPTKPSLFGFTLERLSLGTFSKVVTCQQTTTLIDVLKTLNKYHFASVPIVNSEGNLVDLFFKSHMTRIPHARLVELLDKPVTEALPFMRRNLKVENCVCTKADTLETILGRMMELKMRSLAILDETDASLVGVVALGDILRLFVV